MKKSRGRGRRKVKEAEVQAENIAQTVINENSEIVPVIAENAGKKTKKSAAKEEEVVKEADVKVEAEAKAEVAEEAPAEENAEEKPKRTRRPNRNSQKRTRRTTKQNVEE